MYPRVHVREFLIFVPLSVVALVVLSTALFAWFVTSVRTVLIHELILFNEFKIYHFKGTGGLISPRLSLLDLIANLYLAVYWIFIVLANGFSRRKKNG